MMYFAGKHINLLSIQGHYLLAVFLYSGAQPQV